MGTWINDVTELPGGTPGPLTLTQPPRRLRGEIVAALVTVGILAVAGVGVGFAWSALSPHAVLVVGADGLSLRPDGGDEFFVGEGVFALIGVVMGVATGVAAWYAARHWRGPLIMAALVVGGVAGAVVAWQVGRHLGLEHYRDMLRRSAVGTEFRRPVDVKARGFLLVQPLVATVAYIVCTAWTVQPDLATQRAAD